MLTVRVRWTVFYIVFILYLSRDKGAGALDCVLYCIYLYLGRDEGADSWTVFYIVYVLCLGRDEGAGALDCVLYCI